MLPITMMNDSLTLLQEYRKLKSSRNLPFHTRRDAWVEVNLGAIEHNAQQVRQFVPPSVEIMAVVKANAYGHGETMVLPTLEASGVTMAGVAAMDEAIQIRQAGLTLPILVLGVTPDWSMHYAAEHDVQITIFSQSHLDSLARLYTVTSQPTKVHIKVDTGMHRIGLHWQEAADFIRHCQTLPYLDVQGIFSHFSSTDNPAFTQKQLARWSEVLNHVEVLPRYCHLANSSGVWHYPLEKTNMARVGIALFGYPSDELPLPVSLKPAMGLKARIVHIQTLLPGEGVSYNHTFQNHTEQPRQIATLPLGYADGIPKALSNQIDGLYQGYRVPQVGNITMDQMMIDITHVQDTAVGDVITLIGESRASNGQGNLSITLTDWAKRLNTIEYELMCGLRVRLPKTYVR